MKQNSQLTGAEMNTVIDDLLRHPEPDGRSITGPATTQSPYSSDPLECTRQCRASFLQSLGLREGASFGEACLSLTKDQPPEWFWGLYCCDSTNCGVYIGHEPTLLGQSRE